MKTCCPVCKQITGVHEVPPPGSDRIEAHWTPESPARVCLLSGQLLRDAAGIARIIETEGDRLRLAAHP